MWILSHFGAQYDCNGTIQQAISSQPDVANSVGNQVPYVDGQQSDLNATPRPGSTVTFRPRMSGKAAR